MGVITTPADWETAANSDSPPNTWEKNASDNRYWFDDGLGDLDRTIEYIGADDLPATLNFSWEITEVPESGTLQFYYIDPDDAFHYTDLGAALASGFVTVTVPDVAGLFRFGVDAGGEDGVLTSGVVAIGEAITSFNCDCEDEPNTPRETLLELRTRLMRRLGFSAQAANPPPGMAALLDDFLTSAQRFLYRRFKSLHTERFYTWTMVPGTRYYDLAENEDACTKRIDEYQVTWVGMSDLNEAWYPLHKGIDPSRYTERETTRGYPDSYEIRQCVEVWPAPADAYKLRIKGHFGLEPFAADSDKTTIDSELVFLWALASASLHYGKADVARALFAEAQAYMGALVAGSHLTARYVPGAVEVPQLSQPVFLPLVGE
jgi:hypothetical protein